MGWLAARTDGGIATSVVCIGGMLWGAYLMARRDPDRAATILAWIEEVESASEILAVDRAVMEEWARIRVEYPERNSAGDTLIAATAAAHGLTVATRNTRDFEALGVPVLDPWTLDP
jgi:toxin FitB